MYPPLPEYPARFHALYLQQLMLEEGFIDFDGERNISTKSFFEEGQGSMFAVLLAEDQQGNEVLLKAYSGSCQGRRNLSGWVPHIVEEQDYARYIATYDPPIKEIGAALEAEEDLIKKKALAQLRKELSLQALDHYTKLYHIATIDKETVNLAPLFPFNKVPTGSGDCCAIKLLHFAFTHDLRPVSMAEFYFGASTKTTARHHLQFYEPCDEKCKPILRAMLKLDIVYQDKDLIIIDKPHSLLSVPGRGIEHIDSIETRVRMLYPDAPLQCAVHRLDMDTSGLLILALTKRAHSRMHRLFREQQVKKTYIALLEGVVEEAEGEIVLPFIADLKNRPKQVYDPQKGKWGITKFKRLRVEKRDDGTLATRMLFIPCTGRTHQLRLHSFHPLGLGKPILGDRLYGSGMPDRLYLHANFLQFYHPITQEMIEVSSIVPF